MANDFTYDVVVRLATQGLKQATGDAEGFGKAIDDMSRSGKLSEKTTEQATRAISQQGTAAKNASGGLDRMSTSATSLRYANYDLARSMFTISAGITAAGVGVVAAAGSFESSFTAVERTSGVVGDAVGELRGELIQLTREIPQSFGEIANIGARGAQLGIASDQLKDFTEVVAQFVATSDTVSLDQAVEAFGRISNLTGEKDFNALGSAITLVGVNAAATEAQIVKTTQELAPFAAAANVSTGDLIGLAAAVASLGQPPERARSAFLTLQRVVDGAVHGMNDNLGAFASVLGKTEGEVAALWQQDPGQFIQSFVAALGSVDNLTVAFDQLGINERRAVQVFQALAADARNTGEGMSVLDQALGDANRGFNEGTELQRQYALILDDLSSKWQIFLNSVQEAAAAVGTHLLPAVKGVLDFLTGMVQGFADFAATDIGGVIVKITAAVGGLVAAYALIRGAIALATGAALAFSYVVRATGGAGIMAGLQSLASSFGLIAGTSASAAGGLTLVRAALIRLLAATGVGLVLVVIGSALGDLRGTALTVIDAIQWLGDTFGAANSPMGFIVSVIYGIAGALNHLTGTSQTAGETIRQVVDMIGNVFAQLGNFVSDTVGMFGDWANGIVSWVASVYDRLGPIFQAIVNTVGAFVQGFVNTFKPVFDLFGAFGEGFAEGQAAFSKGFNDLLAGARGWAKTLPSMTDDTNSYADAAFGAFDASEDFAKGLDNVGNGAGSASKEIRTLVDYASDLQGVFSRAFDLRFSGGSSFDKITSTFITIRDALEESARNVQKLKAEMRGLQSDIGIQEYFLGIALEYGDAKRAEAIQANLANLQAELAAKSADLTKEEDKNSKALKGNSKAAIDNRVQMESLVKQYQDHITALASSGMSQADLSRRTAELKEQFVEQATQLGFSRVELEKYAAVFDDVRTAIAQIPRNITVEANADPAIQALNEFRAAADRASGAVNGLRNNVGQGVGSFTTPIVDTKGDRQLALRAQIAATEKALASGAYRGFEQSIAAALAEMRRQLATGSYASGGYTGQGGKYEPAGIVHRGEYVVPKHQVNQRTGLPYADAMGRLTRGASGPGYAGGGHVRSSPAAMALQLASMGPMAMQQFHQVMGDAMKVYLDGRDISESSARNYARQTSIGAN